MFLIKNKFLSFGVHAVVALLLAAASISPSNALAQSSVSVSSGGVPSYSHALAVPPGIAGMTPNLGLLYTGSGLNGPVGRGWSVQGISAITRCSGNRAIDGFSQPVDYTQNDKLCLDGQRLIQTDATGAVVNAGVVTPSISNSFQTGDSIGGGAGAAIREFRTTKDMYARIRAYGSAGGNPANGPAYFKVWTKSGQIYEYGVNSNSTANAQIVTSNGTTTADRGPVVAWPVSRISDTLGNYIDFQYEQRDASWGSITAKGDTAGHEWNLLEVRYTGTSAGLPTSKVVFTYNDRVDSPGAAQDRGEAFHKGTKNTSIRLLNSIRTYINWPASSASMPATALKVMTTKVAYDRGPVSGRSRVVKITECAGASESKCMPGTSFNYSNGGNSAYVAQQTFKNSELATLTMQSTTGNYGTIIGNFFGSGRNDILRWSDNPAENRLYRNDGAQGFTNVPAPTFSLTDQNLFKSDGCYTSIVTDFNGDGLADILRITPTTVNPACPPVANVLFLSNGDGSFKRIPLTGINLAQVAARVYIAPNESSERQSAGRSFYLIDVNNDGLLDIITTMLPGYPSIPSSQTPPTEVEMCATRICTNIYLQQPDGTFKETTATNVSHRSLYADPKSPHLSWFRQSYVTDLNGDGLADLSVENGIWFSRGDGNFDHNEAAQNYSSCFTSLDFNGDGRSDCLQLVPDVPATLSVSDGSGRLLPTKNFNLTAPQMLAAKSAAGETIGVQVGDFDGDGRSDLIRWGDDPSVNAIFLSNGDGTFRQDPTFNLTTPEHQLRSTDNSTDFIYGDFTGSGNTEILRFKASPSASSDATRNALYVKADPTIADQLVSVVTGTGLTTSLVWTSLTKSLIGNIASPRYKTDRGTPFQASYPVVDLAIPTQVVVTTIADTGVTVGKLVTEYSYAGLKASFGGQGWQGFREIRRQNQSPNGESLTTVTQNLQNDPYNGVATVSETRRGGLDAVGAPVLSRSTYIYCDKTAPAGAESSATPTSPCLSTSKITRPYLYKNVEEGWDLNGIKLPVVTTTNSFNDNSDPSKIVVQTTGVVAGQPQTSTKTSTNIYYPDNTANDAWIRGRLQRSTVSNTVQDMLAAIVTSAGSAPLATATQGVGLTAAINPNPLVITGGAGQASAALTAMPGGGIAPYSYKWTRTAGTKSSLSSTNAGNPTVSATIAASDNFTDIWAVQITDVSGRAGTATVAVTFRYIPPPLVVTISPNPLTVSPAGPGASSGVLNATVGGGTPPYSFSWTKSAGTRTAVSATNVASPSISATVAAGDNFTETWNVAVTDSVGNTNSAAVNVTFKLAAPALVATVSPSPLTVTSAVSGTISGGAGVSVTGGISPYRFAWTRSSGVRSSISDASNANPSFSASVVAGDNFTDGWVVTVTDSAGTTSVAGLNVTFNRPAGPPILTLSSCAANSPTTAPTSATMSCNLFNSGESATTSISYSGVPGASINGPTGACAVNTICGVVTVTTGTSAGTYSGTLAVSPNVGTAASLGVALVVNAAPTTTTLTADQSSLSYGTVMKGQSSFKTLTVTNTGTLAANNLTRTVLRSSGTAGDFSDAGGTCAGSLNAGASCTIDVSYDASCVGGSVGGNLTVNGANFTSVVVRLQGSTSSAGACP